jgi:hypothetical protein
MNDCPSFARSLDPDKCKRGALVQAGAMSDPIVRHRKRF